MGLDSYIFKINIPKETEQIYNKLVGEEVEHIEVLYWRKRYNILEWFGDTLNKEIENCIDYELDINILQKLLEALESSELEYDDYLQTNLKSDIDKLKEILKTTDFTKTKFVFHNWW